MSPPSSASGTPGQPLFTIDCPNQGCGARNGVYDENHNCCFRCGWKMFPNPQERERGFRRTEEEKGAGGESRVGWAVEMTFKAIAWVLGIGFGLYVLYWTWWIVLGVALLVAPIFLLFYAGSWLRGRWSPNARTGSPIDGRMDPNLRKEPEPTGLRPLRGDPDGCRRTRNLDSGSSN